MVAVRLSWHVTDWTKNELVNNLGTIARSVTETEIGNTLSVLGWCRD